MSEASNIWKGAEQSQYAWLGPRFSLVLPGYVLLQTSDLVFVAERDSVQQGNQPGRKQQSHQNGRSQQSTQNGRSQQSNKDGRPPQANQNGSRRDGRPRDRRQGVNNQSHSRGTPQYNDTKQTQQQQGRSTITSQPTALLQPSVEKAEKISVSGMWLVLLPMYSAHQDPAFVLHPDN